LSHVFDEKKSEALAFLKPKALRVDKGTSEYLAITLPQ